jgi:HlyD family secretion protein
MPRLIGYLGLLLGIAAVAGAWWWLHLERDDGAGDFVGQAYVLPVTLTTVELSDVHPTIALIGTVRSSRRALLAFELSGTLSELSVLEAEHVQAGQTLARLRHDSQMLALASVKAELAVSQRNLTRLQAGVRDEVIARLAAELDATEAEEDLAALEVERRRTLALSDDVSRTEFDRAAATARASTARRMAAAERLAEARAGTRQEDLDIAAAQVNAAQARSDQASGVLAKTVLNAPWEGTIVRKLHAVGDVLSPGEAVYELTDLAHLEIEVEVPAQYALRLGDRPRVVLRVDEAPAFLLEAVLDVTVPTADAVSRNFLGLVRLSTDAATREVLYPGMFVRIELDLQAETAARVVLSDAVRITTEGPLVVVADAAEAGAPSPLTARFVPIRVLATDGGRSAIEPLEGELSIGDQVVLTGVDLAYPGVPLLSKTIADSTTAGAQGEQP